MTDLNKLSSDIQKISLSLEQLKKEDKKPKRPLIRPFTDICKHIACFYDDKGLYVGCKTINYRDYSFKYKGRVYNFVPDRSSFTILSHLIFRKHKLYHYNIYNSNPILFNGDNKPIIDNSVYKRVLDSDLIKKLNTPKSDFLDFIKNPKFIILFIVGIFALYYFTKGGKIL